MKHGYDDPIQDPGHSLKNSPSKPKQKRGDVLQASRHWRWLLLGEHVKHRPFYNYTPKN